MAHIYGFKCRACGHLEPTLFDLDKPEDMQKLKEFLIQHDIKGGTYQRMKPCTCNGSGYQQIGEE